MTDRELAEKVRGFMAYLLPFVSIISTVSAVNCFERHDYILLTLNGLCVAWLTAIQCAHISLSLLHQAADRLANPDPSPGMNK